jgi:nicotinate phosphoribosyltransferase
MSIFHQATNKEIKTGMTSDVYFSRTKRILEAKKMDDTRVVAEVTSSKLPENWSLGILCGIEEEVPLFEGHAIDVYAMAEGSVFFNKDHRGVREPSMFIEGPYAEFGLLETPLLGLICQSSGVTKRAERNQSVKSSLGENFK